MSNQGWVKLHRTIKDKGYYKNSSYVHLWVHILLSVNHEEKEFMWNGKITKVKRGQIISGRKSLSVETGISESKVQRLLKQLESEHQIEQQITNKFRLISVVNWDKWQRDEQENEQQLNNKRTTTEQQLNTNKNDKNVKNVKNEKKISLATEVAEPVKELKVREDKDLVEIISLFKGVNPSYTRLFSNTTQRSAVERLLKQYGLEPLSRLLTSLPDIVSRPYAPRITTPLELERDMGKLKIFLNQANKTKIITI